MDTMSELATVSREEGIERINKIIKNIRIAMLTTHDESGALHSRPMATQDIDFDGDLWFFSERNSAKVADIRANPAVNVGYLASNDYVSLAGTAHIVDDVAKKRELWNDMLKVWFEDGPESPDVVLIHVEAESAQFWDGPDGGAIGKLVTMVRLFVLREKQPGGESGNVRL